MNHSLSTPLHRSLFALPLLAVALAAATHEPPSIRQDLARIVTAAGIDCSDNTRNAGMMALARMPGDLGVLSRRIHCAS